MVDLNRTVFITALEEHLLPPEEETCSLLWARCGGNLQDWRLSPVTKGYLLRVPNWLHPDDLIMDYEFWVREYHLLILPKQTLNRTDPLPPRQQRVVTLHDFPIDYWHPFYFRQATSGMGILAAVFQQSLRGEGKPNAKLLIHCNDPNLIPHKLIVGHGEDWTECLVELEGRQLLPEADHPPPPDPGDINPNPQAPPPLAHIVLPLLPQWQVGGIQHLIPPNNADKRGTPVASPETIHHTVGNMQVLSPSSHI